jgi:hypothetical protein
MSDTDESCDMCYAQARLQEAMACIEAIPDFDIALFDDPITRAFERLEIAFSTLAHPHEEASRT